MRNEFIYGKRSSFSALTAGEWIAGFVRASEQKKQEIRDLKFVHSGKYKPLNRADNTYWYFTHCFTGIEYAVRRNSFDKKFKLSSLPPGDVLNMTLIRWNNEWWLSGVMYNVPGIHRNTRLPAADCP